MPPLNQKNKSKTPNLSSRSLAESEYFCQIQASTRHPVMKAARLMTECSRSEIDALIPLALLNLDEFERGLLAVARHFIACEHSPHQHSWRIAFTVAAERWGDSIGLPAAYALEKLVRAVLACRQNDPFKAGDPFCLDTRELVTPDERLLLETLHHMRRDNTPAARDAIAVMTHGRMDPDVIRAGLSFAKRFACGAGGVRASGRAPMLRVVA